MTTIAGQHGWSVDHDAEEMAAGHMQFSRRNVDDGRRREYLSLDLDVRGRILLATWAPDVRTGLGAKSPRGENKAAWCIAYLTRTKES